MQDIRVSKLTQSGEQRIELEISNNISNDYLEKRLAAMAQTFRDRFETLREENRIIREENRTIREAT
jgi:hypothetical protein